jgi:hypothetical protein
VTESHRSHFGVLGARFVFRFASTFSLLGSCSDSVPRFSNPELRTPNPEPELRTQNLEANLNTN